MTEEQKKIIEELEKVRWELFRNLANLDEKIEHIKDVLEYIHDKECAKASVQLARGNRNKKIHIRHWDELDVKEQQLWQKLIESI